MQSLCYIYTDVEEDNQSITALACKSLNLSQALHEKCLHLDMSVSTSDEEEAVRMSKVGQGR